LRSLFDSWIESSKELGFEFCSFGTGGCQTNVRVLAYRVSEPLATYGIFLECMKIPSILPLNQRYFYRRQTPL